MLGILQFILGSINLMPISHATVGLGASCRYHPDELSQAMMAHDLIYLTNEFTITALQIIQNNMHLIGGFDDCDAIGLGILGQSKTKITGAKESVALSIKTPELGVVVVENFEITDGYAQIAGGIEIIQANKFTLKNSLVHGNVSLGSGGGIQISGKGTMVELIDSRVFNNSAESVGGGISITGDYNILALQDTEVHKNRAGIAGGGLSCMNHNQINVLTTYYENGFLFKNNVSTLAENLYYDIRCQFQYSTNGLINLLN